MFAKDHQPLPHPDSVWRKISKDDALVLLREEQALRMVQKAELISRISQVAELTADCRHWRQIAESWQQAAEVSRQQKEFYTDYSEKVMNAMQALKTRAEAERDTLRAEVAALRTALEVAAGALDSGLNCGDAAAAADDMDSALMQARAALGAKS